MKHSIDHDDEDAKDICFKIGEASEITEMRNSLVKPNAWLRADVSIGLYMHMYNMQYTRIRNLEVQ